MHFKRTIKLAGILATTALLLASCGGGGSGTPGLPGGIGGIGGGGGGTGNGISGNVTAPRAVQGTAAIALFINGNQFDTSKSKAIAVTATGNSGTYSLTGLSAGSYAVVAWQDTDGNQDISDGDLLGCYQNCDQLTAVTPPKTGINMQMGNVTVSPGSLSAMKKVLEIE